MPQNDNSEMEQPEFHNGSPALSGERRLFFEVIKVAMWDYAHLQRDKLSGRARNDRCRKRLRELRHSIFHDEGSIADIANAIATEPEYLLESVRGGVSDEQILKGYILGKKMRVDVPFDNRIGLRDNDLKFPVRRSRGKDLEKLGRP